MEGPQKAAADPSQRPARCQSSPEEAGRRATWTAAPATLARGLAGLAAFERSRDKERRKLRSHVVILRARAGRLWRAGTDADPAAHRRVGELLQRTDWDKEDDLAAAHDHADELEELIPHIADMHYLRTVLAYELTRTDAAIRLATLLPETELSVLRRLSGSGPPPDGRGEPDNAGDDDKLRMAECLSLLAKERGDRLRHDRLILQLRPAYLRFFAALMLVLLAAIFIAISRGVHANMSRADTWAQVLLVLSAGALGSILAAASRLRAALDIDSFRAAVGLTVVQPLVGATFGIISWLILSAGVVKVGAGSTAWATQAAVAFASGFSEPFALGILRRLTPGNLPAPEDRPAP